MKFPIYLTEAQCEQLKYEVLSKDFYTFLTRHLMNWCEDSADAGTIIMRKNRLINLSRTISGDKIYTLVSDDWGNYQSAEFAWHDSHFFLIFRQLPTVEFIEYCADLINYGHFKMDFINAALKKEGASFMFIRLRGEGLKIEVFPVEEIAEASVSEEHVNIRTLVARMDSAFDNNDYANILHASASIFETMAKEIIGIPTIQDQTLKSFFDRYRADSNLPPEILDYILETYDKRNITALAGHGSLTIPEITKEQAIILIEMTKAFIRIEYRIQREV
jgi:hypothetical protein